MLRYVDMSINANTLVFEEYVSLNWENRNQISNDLKNLA